MKNKTKKRLVTIIPILMVLIISLALVFGTNKITEQTYFNSIKRFEYSKHIQTTTITERETLVYQKIEIMVRDGKNAYHKIEEKTLSTSEEHFETTITEFYYSSSKMYYKQNDKWQTIDFKLKNQLITYNFKKEYFETINFDEKIEQEGSLQGKLKDENVKDVFGEESQKQNVCITIKINKNLKVQTFIIASQLNARNVYIENIYSYDKQTVVLPI